MKEMPRKTEPAPWRKVLYEKQPYPDNYVDASFLSQLRRTASPRKYSLQECVLASGRVTQDISACCLCVCVFHFLDLSDADPVAPVGVMVLTLTLAAAALLAWKRDALQRLTRDAFQGLTRGACVFLLFGYGFAPVLKNLTQTVSTDTIQAMVAVAFLVHLLAQDYGTQAPMVSPTLSFNASLFAAVCLASRLRTILHAFTLLTFAASAFAAAPMLHRFSMDQDRSFQVRLTVGMAGAALVTTAAVSAVSASLLSALFLFVNLGCPLLYLYCQSYKDNIFGPWDEAVVAESDEVKDMQ